MYDNSDIRDKVCNTIVRNLLLHRMPHIRRETSEKFYLVLSNTEPSETLDEVIDVLLSTDW